MNGFLLPLLVVLTLCQEGRTATIPNQETQPEDVKYNLIGYENDIVEGMTPPRPQAPEHFSQGKSLRKPESPYVVEISRKYVKFKTTGFPSQKIRLFQNESEGIQKLSLNFVKLLNSSKLSSQDPGPETEMIDWTDLNPIITISHSGISLHFVNGTEPGDADNEETENRDILWDFLTKYVKNIFEAKVKELKIGEKYADVIGTLTEAGESGTAFENFENALWKTMRLSVDYAETAFEGWGTFSETTTMTMPATEKDKPDGSDERETFRATITTIFAYEEPSPFHVFPSQEFEHRRKDVDSIFYGRGII